MLERTVIARWWQSFGFGIQSKTDYAFLHDVLKEQHPYYAYEDLAQRFPDATASGLRVARLLFRIANHVMPSEIRTLGMATELNQCHLEAAPKRDGGVMLFVEGEARVPHFHGYRAVVITDIDDENVELWQRLCESTAVTYDFRSLGVAMFYPNRTPEHYFLSAL